MLFVTANKNQATVKITQMGDVGASAGRHSARVKDMVACHPVAGLGRRDRVRVSGFEGAMVGRTEILAKHPSSPCANPPACSRMYLVVNKRQH